MTFPKHPLAPDVPLAPNRRKTRWPLNTKPPRCDECGKQPPICECPDDHDHPAVIPDLPESTPTFVSQHEEEP